MGWSKWKEKSCKVVYMWLFSIQELYGHLMHIILYMYVGAFARDQMCLPRVDGYPRVLAISAYNNYIYVYNAWSGFGASREIQVCRQIRGRREHFSLYESAVIPRNICVRCKVTLLSASLLLQVGKVFFFTTN